MVSHPETGSDLPIESDRESGRDITDSLTHAYTMYENRFQTNIFVLFVGNPPI